MPDDRARRAHAIFTKALDLPSVQRREHVDAACAGDTDLAAIVHRLLAAATLSDAFLSTPALETARDTAPPPRDPVPDVVGTYLVIGVLGSGGMATVYEAVQENPSRRVALKVMHRSLSHPQAAARFAMECAALARLRHPGVAQIYEAGTATLSRPGPTPFFAMELIPDALSITEFVRARALPLRQRLAMFAGVCDAVLHGHQHGIIHRDIKPDNILVSPDGVAKVIDFGIARLADHSDTATTDGDSSPRPRHLLGTLSAMSPEQCTSPDDIDVRSDVYALGVLLYELITDRKPHDLSRVSVPEALRIIREEDPPPPASLSPRVPADLDAIVRKAMAKERSRRYAGAGALADDVRRFLAHRTVEANPAGNLHALRLFVRRNPALTAALAAALAALVGGAVVSARLAYVASRSRDVALARGQELEATIGFQDAILSGLNVGSLGERLRASLREEVARASPSPQDDAALEPLEALIARLDVTTVAVDALDEGLLLRYQDSLAERFRDQPEIHARLLMQLATTLNRLGLHARAEAPLRDAISLRTQHLGQEHPDTLSASSALGSLLSTLGRYDECIALLEETRERQRRTLGAGHDATVRTTSHLAGAYRDTNNLARAKPLWLEVLEQRRRTLGPAHPSTLRTLNNLGIVHASQGRFADAEAVWREVITRAANPDASESLSAESNLAVLLQDQGRYADARPILERILASERRLRGNRHALTLVSISALGLLLTDMEDFAAAEPLLREAYEGRLAGFGPANPDTLRSRGALAAVLLRQGNTAAARSLLEGLDAAQRAVLGHAHPDVVVTLSLSAELHAALGDAAAARALSDQTIALARRAHADDPPLLARILLHQGHALLPLPEHAAQGVLLLEDGYDLLTGFFTDAHPLAHRAASALALHLDAAAQRTPHDPQAQEAARRWRERAERR